MAKSVSNLNVFTEISSLDKYEIKSVSAGMAHSLFQTTDGKVLTCGNKFIGQLPIANDLEKKRVYSPTETFIAEDATFCIEGAGKTAIFTNLLTLLNTPNMKVTKSHRLQPKMKSKSKNKKLIQKVNNEESYQKIDSKSDDVEPKSFANSESNVNNKYEVSKNDVSNNEEKMTKIITSKKVAAIDMRCQQKEQNHQIAQA